MKLSDFTIPYPILGIDGAFNDDSKASSEVTFDTNAENFVFHCNFNIDDSVILSLIRQGKAAFACEFDCPKTYYRKTFLTDENAVDIEIPRKSLLGDVRIFVTVVVTDTITEYTNVNFNQHFYNGYKFNLSKGDLLAYLGEAPFDAELKYDELKALGTIVEVKEDKTETFTHFDFSSDKIRIFLPSNEFKNFIHANNKEFADITHASIVQCALISALFSFKEYKDKSWARTLSLRAEQETKLKEFENLGELDILKISKMVDVLLGNPNKRMFAKLSNLTNNWD